MTEKEIKNVVMLYSGGADSRLMLEIALQAEKIPHCVLVDYDQKHVDELNYAKKQLEEKGITYQVIQVTGHRFNSGLTGDLQEGRWNNVHEMNVPARNSWLLSIAAGVAENNGATEVWIGCDMSDYYNEFPDCKQEFIGKMNSVFQVAFSNPIQIVAPLLGMSKELIKDILQKSYGVTDQDMHSGYDAPTDLKLEDVNF